MNSDLESLSLVSGAGDVQGLNKPGVRVDGVAALQFESAGLLGAALDAPHAGFDSDLYALPLEGWAVGARSPVSSIEFVGHGGLYGRVSPTASRPDVAAHLGLPQAERLGFKASISTVGLPARYEVVVQALLDDGSRHPFASINGSNRLLPLSVSSGPTPLLVVTYGRTGSTWLMRLLGSHPDIVAYKPFEYEPRVLSYWVGVLLALGAPTSYLQPLAARLGSDRWWLGDNSTIDALSPPEPKLARLLGHEGINQLALFAQTRVRAFYQMIAALERQSPATLFAEKVAPDQRVLGTAQWLFPTTKCVYLVRDPRDIVLSILAYGERSQTTSFGRERVQSDDDFVAEVDQALRHITQLHGHGDGGDLMVRYEDLIRAPEVELQRIFAVLGIDASHAAVLAAIEMASSELPGMAQHRTAADVTSSVGRWHRELSPERQHAWTAKLAGVLEILGYDLPAG